MATVAREPVDEILERGAASEQAALAGLARALLDARASVGIGAEQLPGLGEAPDADELAGALARNELRGWQARTELYEQALDYRTAAARAGVSAAQISNLVAAGDLLALDGPHGRRLPAWQFHPDTRRGRLEGLARVAVAFPGRILGLSAWMVAGNPSPDGRAPVDVLADGEVEWVAAAAGAW